MFEYTVTNYSEAHRLMDADWPTCVVTVIHRGVGMVSRGPHHLVLTMSDVKDARHPDAPSCQHVRDILAHTENLGRDDRLLVHCWMGRSRSPAAMIAVLMQHGYDFETAYDVVSEDRMVVPNPLLCRHIKALF